MSQAVERIESQWYEPEQLPPKWHMTEEEFVEWYDIVSAIKAEWVDGEVIVMAPIGDVHDQLQFWLRALLQFYVDREKLGRVFGPQFVMRRKGRSRREPDIFFVEAARCHLLTRSHMEGPVDLAMEIVSPESRNRDRKVKYAEYQSFGVREYWIVDPLKKSVDAYQLNSSGKYEAIAEVGGKIESKVLPGWFIRPEWIWADPMKDVLDALTEVGIR